MLDRLQETYRGYSILAAYYKGRHQGRAWLGKQLVREISGSDLEEIFLALKSWVDAVQNERMNTPDAPTPSVQAYIDGLQRIQDKINPNQLAMLRAHYHAENRCLTPSELADVAGYKDIGGVNLWYGFLGQWLFEAMTSPVKLPLDNGQPVYTFTLADYIDVPNNQSGHKVWKMHEELALALKHVSLVS